MQIRCVAGWLAGLAILLAGCGGGGGDTPPPGGGGAVGPRTADYFPLAVGHRWQGADPVTGQGEYMTRVTAVVQEGATQVFTLTGFAVDGRRDQTVLRRIGTAIFADPDPELPEYLRRLGPLKLMQEPLVAGEGFAQIPLSTVDIGEDLDGDGRSETAAIESRVTVVAFERVVSDAGLGTWNDCLHLRTELSVTVYPSRGGAPTTVRTVSDDWYAPGLGPVRQEVRIDGVGLVLLDRLTGYAVGDRRSDVRAPAVADLQPASGARISSGPTLYRVRLDEPLDPYALELAPPVMRREDGTAVPGRWVQDGALEVVLLPDTPLPSGRYRIEPGGIEDRFGNRPDLSGWTFEVDTTAPALVAVSPDDGSVDVPVDTRVTLRFDEPVAASSGQFTLQPVDGSVPAALTLTLADGGRTVHLDPVTPLAWATDYELRISPTLSDVLGNPLPQRPPVRLRTVAGRFDSARVLPLASPVGTVLVADLSGDGRSDLAVATGFGNVPVTDHRVLLYPQQADGSLGPARELPADVQTSCRPLWLAAADLTADGRNDLLVWRETCGLRLLRQTSDGSLVVEWDRPDLDPVAVDDLDGDGLPELIGFGDPSRLQLQRWPIGTDGRPGTPVAITTLELGLRRLVVGDLDRDGRRDLALVTSGRIQTLRQAPGGSFVPGATLSPPPGEEVFDLALADLDGDGRLDLAYITGRDALFWRLQQPDGSFGPEQQQPLGPDPALLLAVDLTGDGRADLVAGDTREALVSLVVQRADGTLAPAERYPFGSSQPANLPGRLAFGDLDGNGRIDIAAPGAVLLQPGPPPVAGARPSPLGAALRGLGGR